MIINSSGQKQAQLANWCAHGNERLGFTKFVQVLE
jgi:hypothetical protein